MSDSPAVLAGLRSDLRAAEVAAMLLVAAAMVAATAARLWTIGWMETLGFVSGGICVWLTVREHVWNWPIGIANNIVFLLMFWQTRLFADAGLQIVYLVLGVYGWRNWVRGGEGQTTLTITRTPRVQWLAICIAVPLATFGMRELLIAVNGAAPLFDALTTVLSLTAQYMLCRKQLEHWYLWIVADLIYIPLYVARGLPLTAFLYGIFLVMCVVGLREWTRTWRLAASGR